MRNSRVVAAIIAPEQAYLVALISRALGLVGVADVPLAESRIRWHRVFHHARRQRVHAWLHRGLQEVPNVPPRLSAVAARIRRDNAQRNLLLAHRLCLLMEALSRAEVPSIAFKGPVAAVRFHGGLDSRPCGDLDILVPEPMFCRAESVLAHCGYQKFEEHPRAFQASFQDAQRSYSVDLHWRVPPAAIGIDMSSLWQHATPIPILGQAVQTFSERDSVIIAAVNAMKEYWNVTLHQFVDLAVALNRLDSDGMEQLIERSRSLNVHRMVLNARFVCQELFPLRHPVTNAQQPAIEVLNQLFRPSGDRELLHTLTSSDDYFVRLRDRLADRCRHRASEATRHLRRRVGAWRRGVMSKSVTEP